VDPTTEKKLAEYDRRRRKIEKAVIVVLIVMIAVLLLVENTIFDFRGTFPAPFNLLFFILLNVNIILIFLLLFLVFRNLAKLVFERRAKVLGSKLRTKLIVAFVSFALVPTVAFFYVALTYITNSIDRWFSIQIEGSLSESLKVAQTYYEAYEGSATFFSGRLAKEMEIRESAQPGWLNAAEPELLSLLTERRIEYNLDAIDLFLGHNDRPALSVGRKTSGSSLSDQQLKLLGDGWKGNPDGGTFPDEGGEMVWGIAPIVVEQDATGIVVVRYVIPESLLGRMQKILTAYEEYTQLQVIEGPLQASYVAILGLIALFVSFSAIWFGFLLSRGMVEPIQKLADGTKRVADGELDVTIVSPVKDEFGTLVENFNTMTDRLRQSRTALETAAEELALSNEELERRRAYMEAVLSNITAGVVSLDRQGTISTINTSARNILGLSQADLIGNKLAEVLDGRFDPYIREFNSALSDRPDRTLERQVEVEIAGRSRTLIVSAALLRQEEGEPAGTVLVIEDLTDLVKAQRMSAWQEVARRIAHEIKNPLTPIQLAAGRLRKRYGSKFTGEDDVFMESTGTIVKQVDELKKLVDEFSRFARMAEPQPAFRKLNPILAEAVFLYKEAHKPIRFELEGDPGEPMIVCDRDHLKRVFINVIDNAVAAISGKGTIRASSKVQLESGTILVTIEDDGKGLPQEYRDRLFEPYFSTKKMGTGLGLAIVHQTLKDMGGSIQMEDNQPNGTRVLIVLPLAPNEKDEKPVEA
jgi:two-component system, NtrC family, nitrogen regulation sensor histidine kinase NtrY